MCKTSFVKTSLVKLADFGKTFVLRCACGAPIGRYRLPIAVGRDGASDWDRAQAALREEASLGPTMFGSGTHVLEGVEGSELPVAKQDYKEIIVGPDGFADDYRGPYTTYTFACRDGHSPRIRDDELPELEVTDPDGKASVRLPRRT